MLIFISPGHIPLWDIRFQKCVKLWQHSSSAPINRLGTSFAALSKGDSPSPHIVVGAGLNETSVFDISNGSCRHCFRVLDPCLSFVDRTALPSQCISLPSLQDVRIPSNLMRRLACNGNIMHNIGARISPPQPAIQSFTGRVGSSGLNYLCTGDSLGFVRYWDFNSSSKCFTVSGLRNSQPLPVYENVEWGSGKVTLCRDIPVSELNQVSSSDLPKSTQNGSVIRPENRHRDAVLDMKKVEYPTKGLLTSSRDGTIKLWK
jgi:WD40 repeat protein